MNAFFEMGGYGAYVWPAYGVSAAALFGLAFLIWRRSRRLRKQLEEAESSLQGKEGAQA